MLTSIGFLQGALLQVDSSSRVVTMFVEFCLGRGKLEDEFDVQALNLSLTAKVSYKRVVVSAYVLFLHQPSEYTNY